MDPSIPAAPSRLCCLHLRRREPPFWGMSRGPAARYTLVMTPREVYQLQRRYEDLPYESPERETMLPEVAAAQAEVGGVVYRIPSPNVPILREKLDKLIERAAKKGMDTVSYRVDDEVERVEHKIDPMLAMAELGYVPNLPKSYRYVVLSAGEVKLAGWSLLAVLTVEPGGVMVSRVPGKSEDRDLGSYTADPRTATHCDYCNKARQRTATFLVEGEDGEVKQVGRNCLADFLGVDPSMMVKCLQWLAEITGSIDDEEDRLSYAKRSEWIETEEYLTHVCTMLRTVGWVAASSYEGTPTKTDALQNILNYGKHDQFKQPMFTTVEEADHDRAVEVLAWAREHFAAEAKSDFDRNMLVAVSGEVVPSRGLGILAYAPVAHSRFLEREVEMAERRKGEADLAGSEHQGQPKDRLELTLKVLSIYETEGHYGTTFITKMRDDAGNVYKWFGSYSLEIGETYEGKWTVKKHDEYKGVKETVVTRPALKEEVAS